VPPPFVSAIISQETALYCNLKMAIPALIALFNNLFPFICNISKKHNKLLKGELLRRDIIE